MLHVLELPLEQALPHMSGCDPDGTSERLVIHCRRDGFQESEGKHAWDASLSELQCETVKSILRLVTPNHVILFTWLENPLLDITGIVEGLLAAQDGEVVVSHVDTGVTFRADRGAKDDEVFGDRSMEENHSTHSIAGIVEHPLVPLEFGHIFRILLLQPFSEVIEQQRAVVIGTIVAVELD